MKRFGFVICAAATLVTSVGGAAFAAELSGPPSAARSGAITLKEPDSELSVLSNNSLSIAYQSPAAGGWAMGAPLVGRSPVGGLGLASAQDVSASYTTHVFGGDIGIFGSYADRPSLLSLTPGASWNFGATVGYAGIYVLGGVSDTAAFGPFMGQEGWAAGFGYDMGSFDLRLTYAATGTNMAVVQQGFDSQQITLGGIYTLSPRFRVNADAFYSGRERSPLFLSTLATSKNPQGTGARVGVQLRF
jgi:predicted porin